MVAKVLMRMVSTVRVSAILYKVGVQKVLLYGINILVVMG